MINPIMPAEQAILSWHDAQSEDTLRDLFDRFDALSPNEAWAAFFADCTPPAQECPSDSLAAPAEAGQGVCNPSGEYSAPTVYTVHCVPGMLAHGCTCKTFASVTAFDAYVSTIRAFGLVVIFQSPAVATVSKPQKTSPDDFILWPCGSHCLRSELGDFSHQSDDYLVMFDGTPEHDAFLDLLAASDWALSETTKAAA